MRDSVAPKKYSLWTLLKDHHKIEIPIIQRDYAQGRKSKEVNLVRQNFLKSIFKGLTQDAEKLDFDFVYGNIEERSGKSVFIPLDGQQRLTTLFLLHWYMACKEKRLSEVSKELAKFGYETRTSSREFCKNLSESELDLSFANENISDQIKNSGWFFSSWTKDPTVQSMLVMLDEIHLFEKPEGVSLDSLIGPIETARIHFHFLALDNFGLGDTLYVKMNARGKSLSDFETFKAQFEQFLEENHPKQKERFAEFIDNDWTDIFWPFRKDNVIDSAFMNYLQFMSQMIYFEKIGEEEIDASSVDVFNEIYSDSLRLEILFSSLDAWKKIENQLVQSGDFSAAFFSKIFYDALTKQPTDLVNIFEKDINLFQQCIFDNGFFLRQMTLLYAVTLHLIKFQKNPIGNHLNHKLRILRNLLSRIRQRKDRKFESDFRVEGIHRRLKDIRALMELENDPYEALYNNFEMPAFKEYLKHETEKAKIIIEQPHLKETIFELEDHPLLQGLLHNFDLEKNAKNLPSISKAFVDIWSQSDNNLLVRALLATHDFSLWVGESRLGNRYYFGSPDGWHTILTANADKPSQEFRKTFSSFLTKYNSYTNLSCEERLAAIIDHFLASKPEIDWRYYFVKYPKMQLGKINEWEPEKNLYAWPVENDFELRAMTKESLRGYHINPYINTVIHEVNDSNICNEQWSWSSDTEVSPLWLNNGIRMFSVEEGWNIFLPEGKPMSKKLKLEYSLLLKGKGDEKHYLLQENEEKDRIEIAVDFCMAAYKL
jgi:hypothetical protein